MAGLGQYDRAINFFELRVVPNSLTPENAQHYKDEKDRSIRFSELPPQVRVSKDANYVDERVPGRSEPWKVYSDSNSTLIDFSAKLVATGVQADGPSSAANLAMSVGGQVANRFGVDGLLGRVATVGGLLRDTVNPNLTLKSALDKKARDRVAIIFAEVHQKAAALEALTYPQYDDNNVAFPPPLVDLSYAQNFKRRGIIRSVNFTYLPPWEPETGLCMHLDCQITMEEVNLVPKSYRDVRERKHPGQGQAGQIQTYVRTPRNLLGLARSSFGL